MTFAEAAMIMMAGDRANIQPLTVTQNGQYNAPEGVDGYNPVDVNVPDRYDEGYKDGLKDGYDNGYADGEAAVKAKIQSKTITENGIYYAADDGLDGFDPVNVNVPDKYDDGYDKGYEDGWEASAGYYDGSGVSTDKPYLLYIRIDTQSIPGYQNYNPCVISLYAKENDAWVEKEGHIYLVRGSAAFSYGTKINYIKMSSTPNNAFVSLTGGNKAQSVSYTTVVNFGHEFGYGITNENCAITNVDPLTSTS